MNPAKGRKGRFGYLAGATGAEAAEVAAANRPEGKDNGAAEEARATDGVDANGPEGGAAAGSKTGGAARDGGRRGGGEAKAARGRSSRPRRAATASKAPEEGLETVPKGKGRMKQERSQLNVRIPTTLKRRAAAKATLEGRDIGEVVEELLRDYLEK